jgi:hypothetical protein
MLRSLYPKIKAVPLLIDDSFDASANSVALDTSHFGSLMFVLTVGAFAFTGVNKITAVIEESDDNVTFLPATTGGALNNLGVQVDNGVIGSFEATVATLSSISGHYLGYKKYARLALTEGGTVTGVAVSVLAIEGNLEAMPS